MNVLPCDKQIAAISALTEGCSIRATERLTDIHRDTIMRLGLRVGEGCAALHDRMMTDLQVGHIELDEIWAFVAKKQRRVTSADPSSVGDQYLYTAMDATGKAILSYVVGKRNAENTRDFLADLRARVIKPAQYLVGRLHPVSRSRRVGLRGGRGLRPDSEVLKRGRERAQARAPIFAGSGSSSSHRGRSLAIPI